MPGIHGTYGSARYTANAALSLLGVTGITEEEWENESTLTAQVAKLHLHPTIRYLLSYRAWDFAAKSEILHPIVDHYEEDDDGGARPIYLDGHNYVSAFQYVYGMPPNCVVTRRLRGREGEDLKPRYRPRQNTPTPYYEQKLITIGADDNQLVILTDIFEPILDYTAISEDHIVGRAWSPAFTRAVHYALAEAYAIQLGGSISQSARMDQWFKSALDLAANDLATKRRGARYGAQYELPQDYQDYEE